jgi:hypothetical protein
MVLATGTYTVPSNTVVEEFDFEAQGVGAFNLTGGRLVVSVLDLTHTDRDQSTLCTNDHPLDGCATVDYGAFGPTHDNRISVDGASGELSFHLWTDRSVRLDAEPLQEGE